jgi:hypothetical protein
MLHKKLKIKHLLLNTMYLPSSFFLLPDDPKIFRIAAPMVPGAAKR